MELNKETVEINSDNLDEKNQEGLSEISLDKVVETVEEVEEVNILKENEKQIVDTETVENIESPEEILRPIPIVNTVEEREKEVEKEVEKVEKEVDKEDVISAVKSQNKMLKVACVGLGLCTILSVGLSIVSFNKATNSDIFISDMENNRVTVQTVAGTNEKYDASTIYANNISSVVAIKTEVIATNIFGQMVQGASAGSGFVISGDGYILTNAHVVEDANAIKVAFSNGKEYNAKLVGIEEENDVAILKIDSTDKFKPVVLGDSSKMTIGEEVLAVGNPLGELTFSMTKGIVSALDREIQLDTFTSINMFQVDCAVNQGNSGGPICNTNGEVIGITNMKLVDNSVEGMGFAIPIEEAVEVAEVLETEGKISRPYIGISMLDISESYYLWQAGIMIPSNVTEGVAVYSVEDNSPASKASLQKGDIIISVENQKVSSLADFRYELYKHSPGETIEIKYNRNGKEQTTKVTLGTNEK